MIEDLLLSAVRLLTFDVGRPLTSGSGFWFRRGERLYIVTARHVLFDEASEHRPNTVQFDVHLDREDLTRTGTVELPLYRDGLAAWVQGEDSSGAVDVAALEVPAAALPAGAVFAALGPGNLQTDFEAVRAGAALVLVAFPLGFYDTLHRLPVVRQATVASAFGVRFQGHGYFLTDARMHRGASGAPVLKYREGDRSAMPWSLLGIHSSRFDMGTRDPAEDESLGLNCAWYADILSTLTAPARVVP